jgi:hypothetical protein
LPAYSMRNDRNRPAMRIAAAVASNWSSPRHSFWNMRLACVKSCATLASITLRHFEYVHGQRQSR